MSLVQNILVITLLLFSCGFVIFGMIAVFKISNLYSRILSAAIIDSMASLTILIALFIIGITDYHYAIRLALLIIFLLITNPIGSHVNIRSAYLTGYDVETLNNYEEQYTGGEDHGQ
jgi:multicomponent Na+:H+ antiporter subunit G